MSPSVDSSSSVSASIASASSSDTHYGSAPISPGEGIDHERRAEQQREVRAPHGLEDCGPEPEVRTMIERQREEAEDRGDSYGGRNGRLPRASTRTDQLEPGRFESVDEIVIEALRLLQEREELFASHREQLRAQIAEGVAAEERGELRDGREAIADVRRRIERLEQRTIDHEGEAASGSRESLRNVRTAKPIRPYECGMPDCAGPGFAVTGI
jgi:antitoxin ParD1/3/4